MKLIMEETPTDNINLATLIINLCMNNTNTMEEIEKISHEDSNPYL